MTHGRMNVRFGGQQEPEHGDERITSPRHGIIGPLSHTEGEFR